MPGARCARQPDRAAQHPRGPGMVASPCPGGVARGYPATWIVRRRRDHAHLGRESWSAAKSAVYRPTPVSSGAKLRPRMRTFIDFNSEENQRQPYFTNESRSTSVFYHEGKSGNGSLYLLAKDIANTLISRLNWLLWGIGARPRILRRTRCAQWMSAARRDEWRRRRDRRSGSGVVPSRNRRNDVRSPASDRPSG